MRGRAAGVACSSEAGTGVARRQLCHIFRFVEKGQVVGSGTVERRNSSDAAIEISAGSRGGADKGGDFAHGEPASPIEKKGLRHTVPTRPSGRGSEFRPAAEAELLHPVVGFLGHRE